MSVAILPTTEGDMVARMPASKRLRLRAKIVSKLEFKDECWEWCAARDEDGYGKIKIAGKNRRTHRISYQLHVGQIAPGSQVLHKCDNPPCVNPDHLFVGSNDDNMADKSIKMRVVRGDMSPHAKLSAVTVSEMRQEYALGTVRQVDLAKKHGVDQTTISLALCMKTWNPSVKCRGRRLP